MNKEDLTRKWLERISAVLNAAQGEFEEHGFSADLLCIWAQQSKLVCDHLLINLPPEPIVVGVFRVWVYLSDRDGDVRALAEQLGGVSLGVEQDQEIFVFCELQAASSFQYRVLYNLDRTAILEAKA